MRPPPRGEPFTDFDELAEELAAQFNGDATTLPDEAKSEWSEAELQMFFASGGPHSTPCRLARHTSLAYSTRLACLSRRRPDHAAAQPEAARGGARAGGQA